VSSSAAAAAAASAASADDNDNEPKKPKKTKEELLALQTTQQTELTRRYEGELDITYAERNDQRALEVRQQKLLTREETSVLLTKLRAEAIDAKHNAPDRPVTIYMSAERAAQRAANSSIAAGTTTTDAPSFGFDPARMKSAGGSSTMLAYPTTLRESRGARDYDMARMVLEVTKHDSAAKKAATETLKAQMHKEFELFRRTQPSDALAVMRFPLSKATPSFLYWVDYYKKQQWMNAPDLNIWFCTEILPDPHRRGGGDALQRGEEAWALGRRRTPPL
jgi:hypothetical protein